MVLEQLWNDYHTELFNFIRRRVNNAQDAEDILQDVFVKAQQHDCTAKNNPRAWLYRTVRTTIIDYYRTQKRYEELPDNIVAQDASDDTTLEMIVSCLKAEARKLPPTYRDVLIAVDFEGKSQQQISADSEVSYATIRSRVRRARQHVKDTFESCCRVFFDYHSEEWNCEAQPTCNC